jgi:NAD-dependent dihydropyrimidine dehydrogenase PreA subunit
VVQDAAAKAVVTQDTAAKAAVVHDTAAKTIVVHDFVIKDTAAKAAVVAWKAMAFEDIQDLRRRRESETVYDQSEISIAIMEYRWSGKTNMVKSRHNLLLLYGDEAHKVSIREDCTECHMCIQSNKWTGEMYTIAGSAHYGYNDGDDHDYNYAHCWECAVCAIACKMDLEEMDAMDAKRMQDQNANCGASSDFDWSEDESSAGPTEFEGDYWMASTEALRGWEGINVRREPCTSSFILGLVKPGDTVLATRERSGSWMQLVDWDGNRMGKELVGSLVEMKTIFFRK